MKYYVIAGEASGDLHGSNLLKALKKEDNAAHFRIWGGDLMEAAGGELVKHYRDLAFMGFVEVVSNIRTILGNIKFCKVHAVFFFYKFNFAYFFKIAHFYGQRDKTLEREQKNVQEFFLSGSTK